MFYQVLFFALILALVACNSSSAPSKSNVENSHLPEFTEEFTMSEGCECMEIPFFNYDEEKYERLDIFEPKDYPLPNTTWFYRAIMGLHREKAGAKLLSIASNETDTIYLYRSEPVSGEEGHPDCEMLSVHPEDERHLYFNCHNSGSDERKVHYYLAPTKGEPFIWVFAQATYRHYVTPSENENQEGANLSYSDFITEAHIEVYRFNSAQKRWQVQASISKNLNAELEAKLKENSNADFKLHEKGLSLVGQGFWPWSAEGRFGAWQAE